MTEKFDKLGIFFSILCVIHCALAPMILFFIPAFSTLWATDEDNLHQILYGLILLTAVLAFIPGYRIHRKLKPLTLFIFGFCVLTVATFYVHEINHEYESYTAILGSIFLVGAHYQNHKSCKHCHEHQHIDSCS